MKPCPKPTHRGSKGSKKHISPRARVKKELYKVLSEIVRWRDGYKCVQAGDGRVACWGVQTDGHLFERAEYGVTFDLLNNHDQCQGHNNWHRYHQTDYRRWFIGKFGRAAFDHLEQKALACEGEKSMSTVELQELLAHYKELWENRPTVYDEQWLIELGYYGAWAKEHLKG